MNKIKNKKLRIFVDILLIIIAIASAIIFWVNKLK